MNRKPSHPPRLPDRFLQWFCSEEVLETLQGDLYELYEKRREKRGKLLADMCYYFDVVSACRPFAFSRKRIRPNSNHMAMYEHYFKISLRKLLRQKLYSSIKIGGFAVGITSCVLIALFVSNELGYDNHYSNGDRIYRILRESTFDGQTDNGAHFPYPFAATLQEEYPEIEKSGRYNSAPSFGSGSNEIRRLDKLESRHEEKVVLADQSLLDILEVSFVKGDGSTALSEPGTIVITQSKSEQYFPDDEPIGKILLLNNDKSRPYTITGVIDDFPVNSHFRYDFLISLSNRELYKGESVNWQNDNYFTYVLLRHGTNAIEFEQKLSAMIDKYFLPPRLESGSKEDIAWIKSLRPRLQPIKDIYLNLDEVGDNLVHGDIRYIWSFGAIAGFILLIACVNFINLSTARSANRAREVGLRKVVGAQRSALMKQFLTESVMFSFFAFVLGAMMAWLALTYFNVLLGKSLIFPWKEWWFVPMLLFGTILIGTMAGLYPAAYLSSFKPIKVLKGNLSQGTRNSSLRSGLVIFQFLISIVLIVCSVVISRQMDFILNKKLGFDKEQVLVLRGTHTLGDKITAFKNELVNIPEVASASVSGYLPVEGTNRNNGGWSVEGMLPDDAISGQQWGVDADYVNTLGLKIVQGRDFSNTISADSKAVVINESLANALQFESPIGQRISNYLGEWIIIGVVEDFHYESMTKEIRPLGMYLRASDNIVSIKLNTSHVDEAVERVTSVWDGFSPNQPIRYTFLDQNYARMYEDVQRTGTIFTAFTVLAILIACLGLFALSSFMIEQRGKEISIRKVLGASLANIFRLLTINFVRLVLIAFVIAVPAGWHLMTYWLQDYVYRIDISWDIFLVAGAAALIIALITVGYQAAKAATANPVKSLRTE